jgi:hypothetical protein
MNNLCCIETLNKVGFLFVFGITKKRIPQEVDTETEYKPFGGTFSGNSRGDWDEQPIERKKSKPERSYRSNTKGKD